MGIKDIPLSTNTPSTISVPLPPTLENILQTRKGPVSVDPQSGSILKVLGENGFREKIQEGYKNGKTYTILHAAPSPDFTLVETWNEKGTPRKNYQFFKIISEIRTPEILTQAPIKNDVTHEIIVQPKEIEAPPIIENKPGRAEEIARKIKKGGAGMTPEDWDYRNKHWPEIEKFLMGPTSEKIPVQEEKKGAVETPIQTENQKSVVPTTQHYESKNWLMGKLGVSKTTAPVTEIKTTEAPTSTSSYDLLKARFAQGTASAPKTPEVPTITPVDRKNLFLDSIFKEAKNEWELAKNIPARAFIYPTEYAWGIDANGVIINHSLEDYPTHARILREKISQSVEDISMKGVNIATLTLDEVLTEIFEKGLM